MSNINYRPELDGLRAISVLGVLLYHAHLGFPGGYVGVDVFFVISGFLITSIIAKGLDNGSFSFAEFWIRRIKRILPAVSVLVLTVLIAGFFILDPESLIDLGKSAFAQSTMWSNFYFLNASSGYFHAETELMPLLHTWSLAVEEQFYLFLPLLLYFLFKKVREHAIAVLSVIAGISFVLSIIITRIDQAQSFYLLHTRAWELLAGALLALSEDRIRLNKVGAELMSAVGLVLIVAPMFLLDSSSLFPGLNALPPVAGAVLFIAGTRNHRTWSGRITSLQPVVFIGLISYSLYLWHWPLFAFARHIYIEPDQPSLKIGLLLASVVLAILSWKYVETPFRNKTFLKTESSAIKFGITATVALLVIISIPVIGKGFPQRFKNYSILMEDMGNHGKAYRSKDDGVVIGDADKSRTDFILWGDSHGMAIASGVDRIAAEQGLKGRAFLNSGSLPVVNLERSDFRRSIRTHNRKVHERILASGVTNLILVARWSNYIDDVFVVDSKNLKPNEANAIASLERQLPPMIKALNEAGIHVFIIMQVPETNHDTPARQFFIRARFPALNPEMNDRYSVTQEDHKRKQASFAGIVSMLPENDLLTIIDPSAPFFDNPEKRIEVYSERSHYRDENHLTEYGVDKFMAPVLETIFLEISKPSPCMRDNDR